MPEFIELNPFADLLRGRMPALIVGKLLIVGGCAAAFVVFWRYKIVQFASWCAATTYVGLAIWWVAYFNAAKLSEEGVGSFLAIVKRLWLVIGRKRVATFPPCSSSKPLRKPLFKSLA